MQRALRQSDNIRLQTTAVMELKSGSFLKKTMVLNESSRVNIQSMAILPVAKKYPSNLLLGTISNSSEVWVDKVLMGSCQKICNVFCNICKLAHTLLTSFLFRSGFTFSQSFDKATFLVASGMLTEFQTRIFNFFAVVLMENQRL